MESLSKLLNGFPFRSKDIPQIDDLAMEGIGFVINSTLPK
jgi:hypothetical protein